MQLIAVGQTDTGNQTQPDTTDSRYQRQYLDKETGLHYTTFRYYDPDIGRLTQPNPIGLLGGFNLYQYAPNGLN
ncbi:RHS repeat-associated core domain-containing protein [Gilliamella sp. B2824]|uniref:RHS repeat-associated core domain-containing protein n=1 Tax=Gilliamella sp. B2824 TaxID=2818019 RepID=UPI003A5CEF5F